MPTYCYKCPCGKDLEHECPMSEIPPSVTCECGEEMQRDLRAELSSATIATRPMDAKYPYVSNRLPKGLEGCPTDAKGRSVIKSKAHEREVCAKHGYSKE